MNKKGIEKQKKCVFPFKYKGITYNKCTKDNSENGQSWCAYKVNRQGVAVDGKWGDCDQGCPGSGKKISITGKSKQESVPLNNSFRVLIGCSAGLKQLIGR